MSSRAQVPSPGRPASPSHLSPCWGGGGGGGAKEYGALRIMEPPAQSDHLCKDIEVKNRGV